jgi:hypothetical protein
LANEVAPQGKVFVCGACGKRSRDRYGEQAISSGWDESCMLNCALYDENKLVLKNGRVVQVKA